MGTAYSAAYNIANRLTGLNSTLGSTQRTLLSNAHYGSFGLTSLNINGSVLAETRGYQNNRGFLSSVSVAQGTTNRYNVALTYAPNGDVLAGNDSVNGNWAYTYDPMNRLLTANKNSGATAYRYDYDRFGNRWRQNLTAGTGTTQLLTFNSQANRIDSAGYTYDAVGNMFSDGTHTYQYDEESRLISIDKPSAPARDYQYDAEGHRVKNGYATSEYLYDLGGHAVTILDANTGAWLRGEAFAGGRHVATFTNSGNTVVFAHADWLGTERVRTQTDGSEFPNSRWTSGPWGDDASSALNPSANHFTGKERDTESGLDYFGARYYGSNMGRWMSPDWSADPVPVPYADLSDPQTLNLYGYVRNNPLSHADADGHCCDWDDLVATVGGALNAFNEANGFAHQNVPENELGRTIGSVAAAVQGVSEVAGGATLAAGGAGEALVTAPASASVAGALVPAAGVATASAGVAISAHGSIVLGNAINQMKGGSFSDEDKRRMQQGKPPLGEDEHPKELHHPNGDPNAKPQEMTQTEHRLGENYKLNHPNTNKRPSRINRDEAARQRRQYWKDKAKNLE